MVVNPFTFSVGGLFVRIGFLLFLLLCFFFWMVRIEGFLYLSILLFLLTSLRRLHRSLLGFRVFQYLVVKFLFRILLYSVVLFRFLLLLLFG
nr:MAG TPA: hypothetical protein [Inoviridae sp.]